MNNKNKTDDLYECYLCSNGESSPSQTVEVSGSESLKSEKFYLASALPDGVLQQVEVITRDQKFWHVKICFILAIFPI